MKKIYVAAVVTGLLVGLVAAPAFAGTAYGNWLYQTTVNPNQRGRSIVVTGQNGGAAQSQQGPNNGTVQSGWSGALPRALNSGGVIAQGNWCYNSGSLSSGAVVGCSVNFSGNGSYKSQGLLRAYNGSGYNTYTSPATTYQNIPG